MAIPSGPFTRWLAVLGLSLLLPFVLFPVGLNHWGIVALSQGLGGFAIWRLNDAFHEYLHDTNRWTKQAWLDSQLKLSRYAQLVILAAAVALRLGAEANHQLVVAYSLAFILTALIAVIQIVRADLSQITGGMTEVNAWQLNSMLVFGSTVPAALAVGWFTRGLVLGIVGGLAWLVAEWAGRQTREGTPLWRVVGLLAVVSAIWLVPVFFFGWIWWPTAILLAIAFSLSSGVPNEHRPAAASTRIPVVLVTGVVTTAAGIAGILLLVEGDGVDWKFWLALVGAALAFGATLVVRGEGLLLVAGLGLITVWVAQDFTVDEAQRSIFDGAAPVMLALGDSYMSGEGVNDFYVGTNTAPRNNQENDHKIGGENNCRRSVHAYSVQVAETAGLPLAFAACSGARAISDGLAAQNTLPAALTEEQRVAESTRNSILGQVIRREENHADVAVKVVVLSLGGNDAGFSKIGRACFLPDSCDTAVDAQRDVDLSDVSIRVEYALNHALDLFGDTPMVIVAYPQLFGTAECGTQLPFEGGEIDSLRLFVEGLNTAVASAIARVESGPDQVTHFGNTEGAFAAARFCQKSEGELVTPGAMNRIALHPTEGSDLLARFNPSTWIHNTFHPTKEGHALIADSLGPFLTANCYAGGTGPACEVLPLSMTEPGEPSEPDRCNRLDDFETCIIVSILAAWSIPVALLVVGGRQLTLAALAIEIIPETASSKRSRSAGDDASVDQRTHLPD